ncbi:MAG: recombinase RecT [Acidaminococcaceae bacterium]|nr:recombinase RecT [Acidaminococcaceae bacterium]
MNEKMNTANVANVAASASQRFVGTVMREFTSSSGQLNITPYQESLIQGYFVACDKALRYLENKRLKDAEGNSKYAQDAAKRLPYKWENVNIGADLAQSIAQLAKLNISTMVRNHLFPVPYLNGKDGKYDMTFQEGYEGLKYKAIKYSLFPIVDIECDLLYTNDKFSMIKDCYKGDSYELRITDPFDRGAMKGGYAYIRFEDSRQNKLLVMSKEEIDKIREKAKSQAFWKDWYNEMALKTIVRKASKMVMLDPKKFDEYYLLMEKFNEDAAEADLANEIRKNANRDPINVTPVDPPPTAIPEHTQPMAQPVMQPVVQQPQPVVQQPVAQAPFQEVPFPGEQPPFPGENPPEDVLVDF